MEISKGFYQKYSKTFPSKVTLEDKFGSTFDWKIVSDESGREFIVTNTVGVYRLYSYKKYAIARLTYMSKGKFKLFVPDSSDYFDEDGPFAGSEEVEFETESEDDEISHDKHDISNETEMDGYMTRMEAHLDT